MSVAYVVLAHHLPEQLARLVRRLLPGGHHVVLHIDRRSDLAPFALALERELADGSVELLSDRVACRWGSYSLVEATVRGVERALVAAPTASHVVLLSGQCYPIKDAATTTRFFTDHRGTSFLFSSSGDGPVWPDRTGNERWFWNGRLERLGRAHFRVGRRLVAVPNRFTPGLHHRRMPRGLRALQGSQWWALDAAAATDVVAFLRARPDVVRFFRRVLVPDENVVQMVVDASEHRDRVVQDDLHYIDWAGAHPRHLVEDDVPALLASRKLFARKLDAASAPRLLDRLDDLQGASGG